MPSGVEQPEAGTVDDDSGDVGRPLSRRGGTPQLRITRGPAPPLPDTAASGTVWRDGQDAVVAFGGVLEDRRWMTVSGVGSFVFGDLTTPVVAYPDRSVADELVVDAYRRTVLPLALQAYGREVLHASAVLGPTGVLAFCAVSGTGKSTIAYVLSRRGYPLWSDDAVQFSIRNGDVDAIPLPFTLRLKGDSRTFFKAAEPTDVGESSPARLAALYVLVRDARAEATRLDSVEAFPAVLTHAYCFDLGDAERKRQMMDSYLKLVVRVPAFRVGVPEGLAHVDQVVDLILETNRS